LVKKDDKSLFEFAEINNLIRIQHGLMPTMNKRKTAQQLAFYFSCFNALRFY